MENAYTPNTPLTSPVARILNRDELNTMTNLFVLNPANKAFLSDPTKHWSGYNTRPCLVPILLLLLGLLLGGLAATVSSTAAAVIAVVFLALIVLYIVRDNRNKRFETQGQLLQATITNVFVRERAGWANILYGLLNILLIIVEFVDLFSSSSSNSYRRYRNSSIGYNPGDFYEVNVDFTAATPGGGQLKGVARQNRADLRSDVLPTASSTAIILYVDDSFYKLL